MALTRHVARHVLPALSRHVSRVQCSTNTLLRHVPYQMSRLAKSSGDCGYCRGNLVVPVTCYVPSGVPSVPLRAVLRAECRLWPLSVVLRAECCPWPLRAVLPAECRPWPLSAVVRAEYYPWRLCAVLQTWRRGHRAGGGARQVPLHQGASQGPARAPDHKLHVRPEIEWPVTV